MAVAPTCAARSSEPPAERQCVRECGVLLAVQPLQFETRLLGGVGDLDEGALEMGFVPCGHGHVSGEPDRGVPVGELLLPAHRRLHQLAPPGRREEAVAAPQLIISRVGCARRFGLTKRARRRDGLHRHGNRSDRRRVHQQRREKRHADVAPWPSRDPGGRVDGSVGAVAVPESVGCRGERRHGGDSARALVPMAPAGEKRPGVGVVRESNRASQHPWAQGALNRKVCGGEPIANRLKLADQESGRARIEAVVLTQFLHLASAAARVDLNADEQLVILSGGPRMVDEFQIGVHRATVRGDVSRSHASLR